MSFAVVGHAEWVTFARVERLPLSGEIVTATKAWDDLDPLQRRARSAVARIDKH